MHDSYVCALTWNRARNPLNLQASCPGSLSALRPSLSSGARVIAREVRVVFVRDTSAICKSNQTYVGLSTYLRTCQRWSLCAAGTRKNSRYIFVVRKCVARRERGFSSQLLWKLILSLDRKRKILFWIYAHLICACIFLCNDWSNISRKIY